MTEPATVGLALIVRDEERSLPRLLDSITGAFDRVVLLDTGSTDDTVTVFEDWAFEEKHGRSPSYSQGATKGNPHFSYEVGHFEWCDDFAKARTAADELLGDDVAWRAWADADDTLHGAEHIRSLCAQAGPLTAALIADYEYAHDAHGNVVCTLKRERIVRTGLGKWTGRVHEAQEVYGHSQFVDPQVLRWVHRKNPDAPDSNARNLRILRAWDEEDPDNPRVLGYLGTEEAGRGNHAVAERYFRAYLSLTTHWDEERAQVHRKLSSVLMALDRPQEALEVALAALAVVPDWPDSHLSLAEACYALGEYEKAIKWAREVLRLGQPESLLILAPLDYSFKPRLLLAASLGALGRVEEAAAVAREALGLVPDHLELRRHLRGWEATSKRENVARTWAGAARLLVGHDEQLKALTLLQDTVPYFAHDHPEVVAARSEIRERLLWANDPDLYSRHYETGGSKEEDMHTDEQALRVCEQLPRAHFLRDGIAAMGEAA